MMSASNIVSLYPEPKELTSAPESSPKPECSIHPHVLLVHWEIYFRAGDWQAAHDIAEALIMRLPDEPIGWIYRSFALKQMRQTKEAVNQLLPAAKKFSQDWR